MQLSDIKKSLFGYKKDQVHHYIDQLNAQFSQQSLQAQTEYQRQLAELEKKVEALSAALEVSESENWEHRKNYLTVADSIIEARAFAEREKKQTRELQDEARQRLSAAYQNGIEQAQAYFDTIAQCRRQLALQLSSINEQLENSQRAAAELIEKGQTDSESLQNDAFDPTAEAEPIKESDPVAIEPPALFKRSDNANA